ICSVHEIDETEDGQMFICMALCEGDSLKKKIDRGPREFLEAISIAVQSAEGLARAHEKGIVHRDIKPANIIVSDRGEVKIVDFGLAKLAGQTKLTKAGTTLGTVAYMSPEQGKGEGIDHRSDIWSLGVVLYEMITGEVPFKGEFEPAVVYSIMNEPHRAVSEVRPDTPAELVSIVDKTLAKDPADRYDSMDELRTDLNVLRRKLEGRDTPVPSYVTPKPVKKKRTKRIAIPAVIVLVLAVGFIAVRPLLFERILVSEPKPVAVVSFENQTGDEALDYLKHAIPNLLITSLEQSRYLRVTTWERMRDLLRQLGKGDVEEIDKEVGFELCRAGGIDVVVMGSYVKAGDVFALDVKVLDVETKALLQSVSTRGTGVASILERQIDELSKEIASSVGLSERRIRATQNPVVNVTTSSMEAYNYFLRGKKEREKFYFNDARKFLEKAVELDSTFAMAYYYLGWTNLFLGDTKGKNDALEKAMKYSAKTTEREKLWIQQAYAQSIEGDVDKAVRILEELAVKYPKEREVHHHLGAYYQLVKKSYARAIQEYKKALALDPNDGRVLCNLGYTYADVGDYENAIDCFKKYASVSPGDANPFDSMADVYLRMGKLDDAIEKFKEALEVKPDFGSGCRIAYVYALKEDYDRAISWIDRYIAAAPAPGVTADGHMWKGFYLYWLGKLDGAVHELEKAAEKWRETGNELSAIETERVKAWMYFQRGDLDLCREHYEAWFDGLATSIGDEHPQVMRRLNAYHSHHIAMLDLEFGRIDSAKTRLAAIESLLSEKGQDTGPPEGRLISRDELIVRHALLAAEVHLAEGRADKAIAVCEEIRAPELPPLAMGAPAIVNHNTYYLENLIARAYLRSGELDKAIAKFEESVTFNPNSKPRFLIRPENHYLLATLYEQKGWEDEAIKRYAAFLRLWKDADQQLSESRHARARLSALRGESN
ncbi:MAG: protein kinase, partial [Candidatus Latescibacterota bacterium]